MNPEPNSFAFTDGSLWIQMPQVRMRLAWRPYPLAEEWLPAKREWCSFRPEFRVIRPLVNGVKAAGYALDIPVDAEANSRAEQKAAAFAAFRNEVPPDIAKAVEPFGSHQWALMLAMQRHKPVVDLALANPVLAYALANSDQLLGTAPEETVRNIRLKSGLKQREIAGWLGFPDTEAMVRLLKRIPPDAAAPSALRCLRSAIKRDPLLMETLAHAKVVNVDVLDLATNLQMKAYVTPKLLKEVSERVAGDDEMLVGDMIAESIFLLREMGQSEEVRPFTSVSQVSCFREELDRKYMMLFRRQVELKRAEQKAELAYASAARRRKQEEKEARRKFPAPPFSGTEFIVPLADEGELADEGWIQHNCVASYRGFVWGGKACIYRVLKPERATLLIVRSRSDGMWRRRELKGLANAAVKRETENAVDAWLAEQQVLG